MKINIQLKSGSFELYSGSGVFSKKKLDKGTEVLLNYVIIKDEWNVLDLGCGIGVVGIAIKKLYPETQLTLTDINMRAIKLTKMNAKLHNLEMKIFQSDLFKKIKEKFDTILTNPPQTAGKDVCFKIIEDSSEFLKKDGILQLVARHNKGGKTLSEKMESVFGNVDTVAKKSGYRLYISKKI